MKLTYNWLREFVATELEPRELAERLTMAGLEVEALTPLGQGLADLRVARVRSVRPHPQADRLALCEVEDGAGVIPVVCGAPNVAAGACVALAPVGATLPGGTQIRKAKIRGEVSEGMLLSEAELGLSANHDGILLLDGESPAGAPLAPVLGLDDWLLEINLTPNRSDCLGVLGVAREVAALTGTPLTPPPVDPSEAGAAAADSIRVEIRAPERCGRYAARIVRGVRVAPSPLSVRLRLGAVGIRAISNVVDATNLVLMEWGHPLHAFDLAHVSGSRIVVREASVGEKLLTLDGVERTLSAEDLVIADSKVAMALAGVMGGESSGVHEGTRDLVLESAWFAPTGIRRTARRHGMHTEASHRFERGTDPVGLAAALDRLARTVVELAGGQVAPGVVDAVARPFEPSRIKLRPARVRALLGTEVSDAACLAALSSIGVETHPAGTAIEAIVPSWRPDLEREVDLVEEVARLAGYDQIPAALTSGTGLAGGSLGRPYEPAARTVERARDLLVAQGFQEVVRLAFTSPSALARFSFPDGRAEGVKIENPFGEEGSVLATALLPGLVETARAQLNHGAERVRLFQVARTHRRAGGRWPFREIETAAALLGGSQGSAPFSESSRVSDGHDLKGTLEIVLEGIGIKDIAYRPGDGLEYAERGQAAELWWRDQKVGEIVMLSGALLRDMGVDLPLYGFEVELGTLHEHPEPRYRPFPRHPPALRDLAVEVPESTLAGEIRARLLGGKWVASADLFDVYRGEGVPPGRKSLAFHVRLVHAERTLTEAEVGASLERLMQVLETTFDAKRR